LKFQTISEEKMQQKFRRIILPHPVKTENGKNNKIKENKYKEKTKNAYKTRGTIEIELLKYCCQTQWRI